MLFHYKAVTPEGRRVLGQLDAINQADLETRLKRLGLDLIHGNTAHPRRWLNRGRTSRRELINFCFQLEQLLRAGVPMLEALADLRDSLEDRHFREIVAGLVEGIDGGQTLSQAMSASPQAFSPVMASLVRAGEYTGQLPEVLANLSESLKWEDELASHTRKLLIYPAFVGASVLAATAFLMTFMVPQLKQFVKNMGQELPLQTRALFFISDLVRDYWLFLAATALLTMAAAFLTLRRSPPARLWFDGLKLKLPVIGAILRKIILARFASTFAMFYGAGIPILETISATQEVVGNRAIQLALEDIEQSIRDGRHVAGAFHDSGFFPPLVVRMLRVGENTGHLDQALQNVSYFYHRDVREAVGKAQAMIEPLLTLLLGVLLGWIMLSVMGPIYDIITKIKL